MSLSMSPIIELAGNEYMQEEMEKRGHIWSSFKNSQTACKSCHIREGISPNSETEYVLFIPLQ